MFCSPKLLSSEQTESVVCHCNTEDGDHFLKKCYFFEKAYNDNKELESRFMRIAPIS